MKQHYIIPSLTVLIFLVAACAHKADVPTAQSTTTKQSYIADKEVQLRGIEERLDAQRDTTHSTKFGVRLDTKRNELNQEYAKLQTARRQLDEVKRADEPTFQEKKIKLEDTIASIHVTPSRVAE